MQYIKRHDYVNTVKFKAKHFVLAESPFMNIDLRLNSGETKVLKLGPQLGLILAGLRGLTLMKTGPDFCSLYPPLGYTNCLCMVSYYLRIELS